VDDDKLRWVGVTAGAIRILVFLTGIHSLPALLGKAVAGSEGLLSSTVSRPFSVGVLIISQVAYYLSFYAILRFIHKRFFGGETFWLSMGEYFFFALMIFALGCGISYLFIIRDARAERALLFRPLNT